MHKTALVMSKGIFLSSNGRLFCTLHLVWSLERPDGIKTGRSDGRGMGESDYTSITELTTKLRISSINIYLISLNIQASNVNLRY